MTSEQYWGFFPRFKQTDASGDEVALDACTRGATVQVNGEHNGKLDIGYKGACASVSADGLWRRPNPAFSWGDFVYVPTKEMHAVIDDICWHFNEERYYFYLTCNGKPVKKRYYEEDLEPDCQQNE